MSRVPEPLTTRSRFRGALLGLAAGDALGTTVEFASLGTFEPMTDIVGGGPFGLAPGQWTDDTSMALCLAESIVEAGWDPVDQLTRYVRWWRDGHLSSTGDCFDIGTTVAAALRRFEQSGEPWCGSTDPGSAGNGSIMRLAPAVLGSAFDRRLALERAAESSRTTHGAPTAVDGCRYLAALLVGAIAGLEKGALLDPGFFTEATTPEIATIAAGSFHEKEPPRIRGTGYVVESLEAALWALDRSSTFEEGALLAVNLGNDADTTGAVYGQLAGAHYGAEAIPAHWVAQLALGETIESYADRLLEDASTRR